MKQLLWAILRGTGGMLFLAFLLTLIALSWIEPQGCD